MLKIERENFVSKIEEMQRQGYDYLVKITAVDYATNLTAIYIIRNTKENKDEILEVELDTKEPWMPTIIEHFKAADWYERELFEMFGIGIKGRRVKRLLLEKWDGKNPPLRKSFVWNSKYETND